VQGETPFCSNTRERNVIIDELLKSISTIKELKSEERDKVADLFREGRVGDLLEFSRAVHAEMDAILTVARKGNSTVGTRLFVTTFPCHYCARHIVAAGIDEVQYIEPYPKSQTLRLHADSVQITAEQWALPSNSRAASLQPPDSGRKASPEVPKVLFRPFTGVAPRLYRRAFLKDSDLKNKLTGVKEVSQPNWGTPWHLRRLGYAELEAELASGEE
jgi:deoxycytidylate deaminase